MDNLGSRIWNEEGLVKEVRKFWPEQGDSDVDHVSEELQMNPSPGILTSNFVVSSK